MNIKQRVGAIRRAVCNFGIAPRGVLSPLLVLVLSGLPRVWAGGDAVDGGALAPDGLPAVAPLATRPLFETRVWEEVAQPAGNEALVGAAVSPDSSTRWLAADQTGAVYLSDDSGTRWTLVMPGVQAEVRSDESLLLEAQALSADSFEGVDGSDPEAESAAVQQATESTAEEVGHDVVAALLPPTVWFDPAAPGVALFGREGEVWRSGDGGETWLRVDGEVGATAFARVGAALVAGGQEGVRASLDGGASWIDVESSLTHRRVHELTRIGDVLYAATDDGLYSSPNALQWSRIAAAPDGALVSVIPDPDFTGGYWVAAERGIFRTDDNGVTFSRFANQPLRGLRRIVHLPEPGHLFAISADGAWESLDAGVKWTPASRLLSDPDVRTLDFAAGEPVIATRSGIWRMVEPEKLADLSEPPRPVMPMSLTVDAALSRSGMKADLLTLAKRTRILPFIPNLTLQATYGWDAGRDADFQVLTSNGTRDDGFGATAQLCWGGCASSTSYYNYETDSFDVEQMVDDGQLTVIDGEVYDANSVVAAAANVSQNLANYRVSAAQQISEAWITRARLVAEGNTLDVPLRDRVMRALAVQEIDSRLDAWTNGQFTTWKPESP